MERGTIPLAGAGTLPANAASKGKNRAIVGGDTDSTGIVTNNCCSRRDSKSTPMSLVSLAILMTWSIEIDGQSLCGILPSNNWMVNGVGCSGEL